MPVLSSLLMVAALMQSQPASEAQKAYNDAFRTNFRATSIRRCTESIKAQFPNDTNAPAFCSCVTEKLLQTKSVSELSKEPTAEEYRPIMMACLRENPPPGANRFN